MIVLKSGLLCAGKMLHAQTLAECGFASDFDERSPVCPRRIVPLPLVSSKELFANLKNDIAAAFARQLARDIAEQASLTVGRQYVGAYVLADGRQVVGLSDGELIERCRVAEQQQRIEDMALAARLEKLRRSAGAVGLVSE